MKIGKMHFWDTKNIHSAWKKNTHGWPSMMILFKPMALRRLLPLAAAAYASAGASVSSVVGWNTHWWVPMLCKQTLTTNPELV